MRTLTRLMGVIASVVVLIASTIGVATADADRPFKGTVNGQVTFAMVGTNVCPALGLQTQSNASGQFTHLGSMSMYSEHCTPTGAAISGGVMTLTAANGDQVYLSYDGLQLALPDFMGGTLVVGDVIPVEGTFVVTGGTGRFDDAAGGGTWTAGVVYEGLEDPSWAGTWSFTGTINY